MLNENKAYRLSICIPTYNGAPFIAQALDSILAQIEDYPVEVVINDDLSSDQTIEIVRKYQTNHKNISLYINQINLGMDRNFTQSALNAQGEFVWLCGQDDIFRPGTIQKFFSILEAYPTLNFVYFNYRFYNNDLSAEVEAPKLDFKEDYYFETSDDYFKKLDHPPSFLPATIMKQKYWPNTNYSRYFGTHYVQVGVWLDHFKDGHCFVVSSPDYIVCRIPDDSWKVKSGKMLFEIFLGSLETYHSNSFSQYASMPREIYFQHETKYIKNFPGLTTNVERMGFNPSLKYLDRFIQIFIARRPFILLFYFVPILLMPLPLKVLLHKIFKPYRNKFNAVYN